MSTNPEKLNFNKEYSDRAFSSRIMGFKYCRVYSASEARLSSNSTLSFPGRITFDNTLGTSYVVWDVLYDLHSGDSSINIRLAYDNTEMCRPSCELEIEIDGIRIGPAIRLEATSSLVKYTNSLPIHFSSNAEFQNSYSREIKFKWEGDGIGPSILHMEIFKVIMRLVQYVCNQRATGCICEHCRERMLFLPDISIDI